MVMIRRFILVEEIILVDILGQYDIFKTLVGSLMMSTKVDIGE